MLKNEFSKSIAQLEEFLNKDFVLVDEAARHALCSNLNLVQEN